MSVLEREITHPVTDPTAGLELVTGDEINLEATRYIFLAADLMDPARSRDIGMLDGGEELENRCLRRTSGRIPRCFITPMELWVEWMPLDLFPAGMEHMALKLKGAEVEPGGRIFKPLFGYPYYPGHLIIDAVGVATGERRGAVEIESLRGIPYGKDSEDLNKLFFPADFKKPLVLQETRDHIERVADNVADPDVKDAANFMLLSCDQSRDYMQQIVSVANTQLDQRVIHEYTYRLTPKIRHFMAQLGIKPRSEPAVQVKEAVDSAVSQAIASQPGLTAEMLAGLGTAIGSAVKEAMAAALAASKPTEPEPVEAPKATKGK